MSAERRMDRRTFMSIAAMQAAGIASLILGDDAFGAEENMPSIGDGTATNPNVTLCAAGDVALCRPFEEFFKSSQILGGTDFAYKAAFEKVRRYFEAADFSIVNLEAPLTRATRLYYSGHRFNFKCDPSYVRCLLEGKVNAVNLANNHLMDYGPEGAKETMEELLEHGIAYFGAGNNMAEAYVPLILEKNGIKFAFLGFNALSQIYDKEKAQPTNGYPGLVRGKIEEARKKSDIVVVSLHWGIEYSPVPSHAQVYDAKSFIDAGVNVILGHHPHVLQGISEYNGGVIFYSLGNFVFAGNTFPKEREAMMAKVEFTKKGVESYEAIPVITHPAANVFQPYVPDDENVKRQILDKIEARSEMVKRML